MVCLGNICRSPLAEGILRHKIKKAGLQWHVESAGTGSWHVGEVPDPRSQKIAKQNGIDISQKRAQKFIPAFFEKFDRIYVMDSSNYLDVISLTSREEDKQKVYLIMNTIEPGKNIAVPDPYYDDSLYQTVYDMLDAACDEIILN